VQTFERDFHFSLNIMMIYASFVFWFWNMEMGIVLFLAVVIVYLMLILLFWFSLIFGITVSMSELWGSIVIFQKLHSVTYVKSWWIIVIPTCAYELYETIKRCLSFCFTEWFTPNSELVIQNYVRKINFWM
jgi:hypothetical protein